MREGGREGEEEKGGREREEEEGGRERSLKWRRCYDKVTTSLMTLAE